MTLITDLEALTADTPKERVRELNVAVEIPPNGEANAFPSFICPICEATIRWVRGSLVGKTVDCPNCATALTIANLKRLER